MEIQQVKLVYFSPTGTTQKILESIARGTGIEDIGRIPLTLPQDARKPAARFTDELVIIGAPVYGGRLPVDAVTRFQQLKADNTPAILIVLYGNREFEDALLELKNLAVELGFTPLAAGAFIGEHSFATKEFPIAKGRPDDPDLQKAMDFGKKIRDRITSLKSSDSRTDLEIPGRFPYEGGVRAMAVSPVTNEDTCTLCGTCAGVCPTAAISVNSSVETKVELCIRCCACIKNCPEEARVWEDAMMETITKWLYENCSARKEPQIFGIENQ